MKRLVPTSLISLVGMLVLGGAQLALGAGPPAHTTPLAIGSHTTHVGKLPKLPKGGTVVQTDRMWVCKGPVNLESVTVTMTPAAIGARKDEDAVHLQPGCTGHIGQITIVQWAGDGIKAAEGVHDLTIDSGSITCPGKAPNLHQDGVQVMGGERITFSNMNINCGRAADRLIDSNFFVKRAGQSVEPPSDVVCDRCTFGGWTAHTVNIQSSLRSGITNSRVCTGRFPKLTLTIGAEAVSPVNRGNIVAAC